jgi:hypothetical protein
MTTEMMIPKRKAPQTTKECGTVNAKSARLFWPVLHGMVLTVALCAFVPFLAGLLDGVYGRRWVASMAVFVVASFTLMAMIVISKPETPPAVEGEWRARQLRLPPWSLVSYCLITGLGCTWVCTFLCFSRRYAFFSAPVISATGLIMASYAAIALLVARLTGGNWRAALLFFAFVPVAMASIVLRLGLLR